MPINEAKWEQWLDGNAWRLVHKKDYWGDVEELLLEGLQRCSSRGMSLGSSYTSDGVEIQAIPRSFANTERNQERKGSSNGRTTN